MALRFPDPTDDLLATPWPTRVPWGVLGAALLLAVSVLAAGALLR